MDATTTSEDHWEFLLDGKTYVIPYCQDNVCDSRLEFGRYFLEYDSYNGGWDTEFVPFGYIIIDVSKLKFDRGFSIDNFMFYDESVKLEEDYKHQKQYWDQKQR